MVGDAVRVGLSVSEEHTATMTLLSIWVVYDHPTDFPTEFVARRHEVDGEGSRPTNEAMASRNLSLLRDELAGRGLTAIPRFR